MSKIIKRTKYRIYLYIRYSVRFIIFEISNLWHSPGFAFFLIYRSQKRKHKCLYNRCGKKSAYVHSPLPWVELHSPIKIARCLPQLHQRCTTNSRKSEWSEWVSKIRKLTKYIYIYNSTAYKIYGYTSVYIDIFYTLSTIWHFDLQAVSLFSSTANTFSCPLQIKKEARISTIVLL